MKSAQVGFQFQLEGGVGTITLDRPERLNALTFESYRALRDFFIELDQRPEVRALLLTGAGRAFCAGGDREDIIARLFGRSMNELLEFTRLTGSLIQEMRKLRTPIVAALNGVAVGAGAVMAIASDLRIASEKARIGFVFPHVGLCGADMGAAWLLPRLIGLGRATELLYSGEIIDAARAESLGLFNEVVSPEAHLERARWWAQTLADGPAFAHRMTKQQLESEATMGLAEAIEAEAQAQAICMQHPDFQEAYQARVEKRAPQYKR